jgi:hypothetical protein
MKMMTRIFKVKQDNRIQTNVALIVLHQLHSVNTRPNQDIIIIITDIRFTIRNGPVV